MINRSRRIVFVAVLALLIGGCGGGGAKTTSNPTVPPSPVIVGLDSRPNNATCIAPARAPAGLAVDVTDAFPALLVISQPVKVLVEPVAVPRWFVLRKTGQLVVFDPGAATSCQHTWTCQRLFERPPRVGCSVWRSTRTTRRCRRSFFPTRLTAQALICDR